MFITEAWAQTAAPAAAGGDIQTALMSYMPILLIFAVFYFLVMRPQAQRAKEHATMLSNLKKGDRVLTNGGFYADILKVGENESVQLQLADGVEVEFAKASIANVVKKSEAVKSKVSTAARKAKKAAKKK